MIFVKIVKKIVIGIGGVEKIVRSLCGELERRVRVGVMICADMDRERLLDGPGMCGEQRLFLRGEGKRGHERERDVIKQRFGVLWERRLRGWVSWLGGSRRHGGGLGQLLGQLLGQQVRLWGLWREGGAVQQAGGVGIDVGLCLELGLLDGGGGLRGGPGGSRAQARALGAVDGAAAHVLVGLEVVGEAGLADKGAPAVVVVALVLWHVLLRGVGDGPGLLRLHVVSGFEGLQGPEGSAEWDELRNSDLGCGGAGEGECYKGGVVGTGLCALLR